ncbi:uncharacterized protein LOC143912008 [Arctopsyche grandis]|uniref:uncharacterized protein LOC143912008 n=1 Tax=Arctopsyche grandis TaxID=121162 RepID=UPI00406D678C
MASERISEVITIEKKIMDILTTKTNSISNDNKSFLITSVKKLVEYICENENNDKEQFLDVICELRSEFKNLKNNIQKDINILKTNSELNILKSVNKNDNNLSYANALKKNNNDVTIIVPKKIQDTDKTKNECKNLIKPKELKIGIQGVKKIGKGGIAVTCNSAQDSIKLIKEVENKLGENYNVKRGELKNPKIKIVDMSEELTSEQLAECLMNQNQEVINDGELKVLKIWKSRKNNKYNAIVEVDCNTFKRFIEDGKVNINWDRCRVFEEINILRCLNCYGFNHKAVDCRNKVTCAKCGEEGHKSEGCNNKIIKCNNCFKSNNKLKLNLNTNHGPLDTKCSVYKRNIELMRNRIKYNNI